MIFTTISIIFKQMYIDTKIYIVYLLSQKARNSILSGLKFCIHQRNFSSQSDRDNKMSRRR